MPGHGKGWRRAAAVVMGLLCLAGAERLQGEVTRVEVARRLDLLEGKSFGLAGAYEKIEGKVYYELDPQDAHNRVIADLDKAPRNAGGKVSFSADLYILTPKDPVRRSGTALLEISNRGSKSLLGAFCGASGSLDPSTEAEVGDGFLLRQGLTLVWVGWQFDAGEREHAVRLYAPVPTDDGKPIVGMVRFSHVPLAATPEGTSLAPYPVLDVNDPRITLDVLDTPMGPRHRVPRDQYDFPQSKGEPAMQWRLRGGFEPGKIYELMYPAANPPVAGCGLAAVRDLISHLKYSPSAVVPVQRAYAYGFSQSGRFLRQMLYQGFNADEQSRAVFDALFIHGAGGGRGSFNHRFAQPGRTGMVHAHFFYPIDIFPFSDLEQSDPETGLSDGLLTHAGKDQPQPKIFYLNSGNEYWGRAASLVHASLDGKADVPLAPQSRLYVLAGAQHVPGKFPPAVAETLYPANPMRPTYLQRALLVAMDRWVTQGVEPPASCYPKVADGTLVKPEELAFPVVPGVRKPGRPHTTYRIDYGPEFASKGLIEFEPPKVGKAFTMLVPQVDADGNEVAGIRLPELMAPLATYTTWNYRSAEIGAPNVLANLQGAFFPLSLTKAERELKGDPRLSVQERYPTRDDFMGKTSEAARALVKQRFLLPEDMPAVLDRAAAEWELAQKSAKQNP